MNEFRLDDVLPDFAISLGDIRLTPTVTLLDADRTVAGWDAASADIAVKRNVFDGPWVSDGDAGAVATDTFEYRPGLALLGFVLVGIALGVLTRRIKGIAVEDHPPRAATRVAGHSRRPHSTAFPAGT